MSAAASHHLDGPPEPVWLGEGMSADSLDSDALAYIAITRLQNEYADVVSRRAWDEVDDLFTADSNVRLNLPPASPLDYPGRGGIGPFIAEVDRTVRVLPVRDPQRDRPRTR